MENFQDRGVWIRIRFVLRGWIRIRFVLRCWIRIRIRSISDRIRNPASEHLFLELVDFSSPYIYSEALKIQGLLHWFWHKSLQLPFRCYSKAPISHKAPKLVENGFSVWGPWRQRCWRWSFVAAAQVCHYEVVGRWNRRRCRGRFSCWCRWWGPSSFFLAEKRPTRQSQKLKDI